LRPVDSMKLWSVRSPQVANRASTWFELRTAALPVVSTGIGAIPEIVEDGFSGYLLEAADGLAQVLELLPKDRARAREMGIPGREIVEQRLDSRRTTDLLLQLVGAAAREFIA